MFANAVTLALMIAAVPSALVAQSAAARDSALIRDVRQLSRAMEEAFGRGELTAVAAFFDDHAVIHSARAVGAAGRAAIDTYFTSVPSPKAMTVETYDVAVHDDVAHHTGVMTLVFGEPVQRSQYQVALTWRRHASGRLRIASMYYHVPEPPETEQAPPTELSPARAALWREIRAVNDSMEVAFGRGDMKAVSSFFADDAQMSGGGPIIAGRAAMDAYWARLAGRPGRWELDVFEVGGNRDLAYQRGRSRLYQADANGVEQVSTVDFVVIWRREPNGAFRILMDIM